MNVAATHEVVFPDWYDELAELEFNSRGYLPDVEVRLASGARHSLYFYDPVRLAQDLEMDAKHGRPYVAEQGLIVVPEISRQAIIRAVAGLVEEDFFAGKSPSAPEK